MARITYNGKKTGLKIALPTGTIEVDAGSTFDVKGMDLAHMKSLMDINKAQGVGLKNQAFVLADDLEIEALSDPKVLAPKKIEKKAEIKKDDLDEMLADYEKMNFMKLKSLFAARFAEAELVMPRGIKKKELLQMIRNYLETKEN